MAEKKRKSKRSAPVEEAPGPEEEAAAATDTAAPEELVPGEMNETAAESAVQDGSSRLKTAENGEDEDLEFADDVEWVGEGDPEAVELVIPGEGEEYSEEEEESPAHSISRKEVLVRLLEKNEMILKLSKEKAVQDGRLKELNDKWIRSVAEFENYRKRTRKEWELLKQQAKSEVILDILHVVDDFERAFSVAEDTDDEFVQGIKLIYNNLTHVLERTGIREIKALHEPFDPNYHMAIGQVDNPDGKSGTVVEVVQKGYLLDDIVIRPANVIVAK